MTETSELATTCPTCGEIGEPHCLLAACDWMLCPTCTRAASRLFERAISYTWDVHTGRCVQLPRPASARDR